MLIDSTAAALYVHTLLVDLIDLIHTLGVQNDTAGNRNGTALSTAAATPGGNGDLVVVSNLEDLAGLLCVCGGNNNVSLRHSAATVCPHSGKPEIVDRVGDLVNGVGRDILSANSVFQFCQNIEHEKIVHLSIFLSLYELISDFSH